MVKAFFLSHGLKRGLSLLLYTRSQWEISFLTFTGLCPIVNKQKGCHKNIRLNKRPHFIKGSIVKQLEQESILLKPKVMPSQLPYRCDTIMQNIPFHANWTRHSYGTLSIVSAEIIILGSGFHVRKIFVLKPHLQLYVKLLKRVVSLCLWRAWFG